MLLVSHLLACYYDIGNRWVHCQSMGCTGNTGKSLWELVNVCMEICTHERVCVWHLFCSDVPPIISPVRIFPCRCLKSSLHVLPSWSGCPNPLFLSPGSTVPLSALRMSETMAVAMVMPHCNILLQARLPMLAAASKPGKATEEGGEGRGDKRTD